ncbi:MAG TPA: rhombotarget lipoprotein [Holophagaceae bacterium]
MSPSRCTLATPLLLLALGCATPETVQRRSSLASYLGAKPAPAAAPAPGTAEVELPFRLGIAFVPADPTQSRGDFAPTNQLGPLGPGQEPELHAKVAASFAQKAWARDLKTIPSLYLAKGGGWEDLDKVARSFQVDVIALVSVDQVQFSNPKWYAWTYWTLVGAYMVKGDKNDTTTVVDAAVYHVPSRTLLFRAGGVGTAKGTSTWSGREDAFRQQSRESLALAMTDLSASLDREAGAFRQAVAKGARTDVRLRDPGAQAVETPSPR